LSICKILIFPSVRGGSISALNDEIGCERGPRVLDPDLPYITVVLVVGF
jgi:hypothetical protein